MADVWLVPELEEHEAELDLETRADFQARTGRSTESLSSMFTRYANRVPRTIKTDGKLKYFLASELDEFVAWVTENSGTRTEVEVREAEAARQERSIEAIEKRVAAKKRDLMRTEAELAKARRQHKNTLDDLAYLKQVERSRKAT